ncbi:hypothetical protein VTJ49DRAFT_7465 [Mycothermus thermophilus]|uniref:Chitin synthase export chaperone n=1 Tax=Humicola insolens TaxID=85995 RepID=A0ABR3VGQ7_HUMIN
MGSTRFGNFDQFCADTTLPVCNLLSPTDNQAGPWNGCELKGIPLSDDRHLGNLGSIIFCGIAIAATLWLLHRSERKRAAVGRRQVISRPPPPPCIAGLTVLAERCNYSFWVRLAFSAIHIGAIAATTWMLFLNAIVGYQLMDDGTRISVALVGGSALMFLIGVGYIALDTGFSFTGFWDSSLELPNRNISLYVLYLLVPLLWIVLFFVLESVLVLKVLGEIRPMLFLVGAAVAFAAGQVFNFVVSPYICNGTSGAIDGSMFQTLFTLISVVLVWIFWSSITEDDWDMDTFGQSYTSDYNGAPGRRPSSRV